MKWPLFALCFILQLTSFTFGAGCTRASPLWKKAFSGEAFPYMVSLQDNSEKHFCGGTILSELYIITAASCVYGKLYSDIQAMVGTLYLVGGLGTMHSICNIKIHEEFNSPHYAFDIAILKVCDRIKLQFSVWPIFYDSPIMKGGEQVTVSGWSRSPDENGTLSSYLNFLETCTMSDAECENSYPKYYHSSHLCTSSGGFSGACYGDGGGPLVITNDAGGSVLVGIVSYGVPCGKGYPDGFTYVRTFVGWIYENTKICPCFHGNPKL